MSWGDTGVGKTAVAWYTRLPAARGADLGAGDLVVQQQCSWVVSVGVPEAPADGLDGYPGVDQLGGVSVTQLVDLQADLGQACRQRPAAPGHHFHAADLVRASRYSTGWAYTGSLSTPCHSK
jgi:hypothetical protein